MSHTYNLLDTANRLDSTLHRMTVAAGPESCISVIIPYKLWTKSINLVNSMKLCLKRAIFRSKRFTKLLLVQYQTIWDYALLNCQKSDDLDSSVIVLSSK